MTYVAGIDIGSVNTKAVLLQDGTVIASEVVPSRGNYRQAALLAIETAMSRADVGWNELGPVGATGVGAANAPAPNRQLAEAACHAKGINLLFPSARTIIDIGGQGSRVIRINDKGGVTDFTVSDKCASGSGRFLEMMARVLHVPLADIGTLALSSTKIVKFNTVCAVFAESEAISRIAEGADKEDILAGVHEAMALTLQGLVNRVKLERECAVTGGGAKDAGLVRRLQEKMAIPLLVPEEPLLTAALGAGLMVG